MKNWRSGYPIYGRESYLCRRNLVGFWQTYYIILDHGDNVTSIYAHLDKIYVVKGNKVTLNQVIGKMGTTGWSTGPHLHFQINVFGLPVNPRKFLGQGTI